MRMEVTLRNLSSDQVVGRIPCDEAIVLDGMLIVDDILVTSLVGHSARIEGGTKDSDHQGPGIRWLPDWSGQ